MRSIDERMASDGTLLERYFFADGAEVAEDEFDAYEPPLTPQELTDEVRGIRQRVAAADVATDDARAIRDAVAGPRPK